VGLLGALIVLAALGALLVRRGRQGDRTEEAGPRPADTVAATPSPMPAARASYSNAVLDAVFPDPTVIRADDGAYYAYATQLVEAGRAVNVQVATSSDLRTWRILPDALPDGAAWAATTQAYWAPHVKEWGGMYYLYYAAQPDGREDTHCLGVATSQSPAGPFKDKGEPFYCGPTGADIDPMAFDDPKTGESYLYWGSGGVIVGRELAPDRLGFAPDSEEAELLVAGDYEYEGTVEDVVEGPWVAYRGGWYYLYYSGDNCCEYPAHYAVMVARSRHATGPFEKLAEVTGAPHSAIVEASGRWNGPGHNSVLTDASGQDWLFYHAIDTRRPHAADDSGVRRVMLMDHLVYRDGWPRVEGGAPSDGPRRGPVAQ
jgi:arabinan endo-1,5-alpha-L-arabinosidase